jgi:hypothetical protein
VQSHVCAVVSAGGTRNGLQARHGALFADRCGSYFSWCSSSVHKCDSW